MLSPNDTTRLRPSEDAMLSVIIPNLNSEQGLKASLNSLAEYPSPMEILIADAGSTDDSWAIAERYGAQFLAMPAGRGSQLAAGAQHAKGDWLLFLHADTRIEPGWAKAVETFIENPAHRQRAAYFRFALDDDCPQARRMERLVAWRCANFGLPYGDQGLLIRREFYEQIGQYAPLPLMEDVDLVRRIGKTRLSCLAACAITSAERYQRDGYLIRPLRNLVLLGLYHLGLPPRLLARLYG